MHGADCVPRGKREEGTRSSSKVSPEAKPGRNRGVRIEAEALRELEFMGSEAEHECFSRRLGKRFEWHHDLVISIAHLVPLPLQPPKPCAQLYLFLSPHRTPRPVRRCTLQASRRISTSRILWSRVRTPILPPHIGGSKRSGSANRIGLKYHYWSR
jgi:hypothetical protein